MKFVRIITLVSAVVVLGHHAKPEGCEEDVPSFIYPRMFLVTYKGPPSNIANRTSFAKSLGTCLSVEDMIEQMMEYYEPYGFDMTSVREDPFRVHEDSQFTLFPLNQNIGVYRVVLETFFEYAKFLDTHLDYGSWILQAKTTVTGPKGTFNYGDIAVYSMLRFQKNDRDFCVQANEEAPIEAFPGGAGPAPISLALYNKHWGKGKAEGITTINGTELDVRYTMTFPA